MKPSAEIRVLHVDDDRSFLDVSKTILSDEGNFQIELAYSVEEALSKLNCGLFDVVISDYDMPIKNGLDFLKLLREKCPDTPFILFTGKGREEIAVQALNLGADRYLNKQGDPKTVYTELSVSIFQLYEKSRAQKMLWESEERFKKMVTNSKEMVMLTRNDGIILYVSPACKKILGYESEELTGKNPSFTHPEDKERVQKIFQSALTNPLSDTIEYRILTKQGETRWLSHSFSQIIENGEIKQIVSTIRDITETKTDEQRLIESEEKFSAAFNSSGAGLSISRLVDGLFIDVNDYFLKMFGYTREEVIGKTSLQIHLYANPSERQEIVNLTINNQPVINREVKALKKDNTEITVLFSTKIVNIRDQPHLLTTFISISELKQTTQALSLKQKELENIFEAAPDAIIIFDKSERIINCNEVALKICGYTKKEELIGTKFLSFVSEKDQENLLNKFRSAMASKQVVNIISNGKRRDGKEFTLESSGKAIHDALGNPMGFITICRDITERKKIDQRLKESEERYRFVAENAMDLITVHDLKGTFLYASPSIKTVMGTAPEDIVGKKSILEYLHPDDIAKFISQNKDLLEKGEVPPFELNFITSKGLIWLEAKISIVKDESGEKRIIAISRDITQRRKDREERDKALAKAELLLEKLSVVGSFVRHDIRNKLTIISSLLYLTKKHAGTNEPLQKQLHEIAAASKNINRILEFAETYEIAGSKGLSWIKINNAVNEAKAFFADLKSLKISATDMNHEVLADSALTTIFHNLIDNSLKYGRNLTQISISTKKQETGSLKIIYEDNGGGIDTEIKQRLFQKGAGKGTGLGLYLIKCICEIYNWSIQENGEQGKSARFEIEIPPKCSRPLNSERYIKMQITEFNGQVLPQRNTS